MRLSSRSLLASLAVLVSTSGQLHAQKGTDSFKWYIGPQAGVMFYKTQNQSTTGAFAAGAHVMITAKRTALMVSYDQAFRNGNVSSFADPSALTGVRSVKFNNVGRLSFMLLAMPVQTHFQPFVGLGFGILRTVRNYPDQTGLVAADEVQAANDAASTAASYGFGAATVGLQLRAGPVAVFGQYQISTGPGSSKLLVGANHTIMGGIRISLGSSKDDASSSVDR
ncbi:MAG: hypothetical protein ABJC74_03420 [Gemmatimonadota bacterium]